MEDLWFVNVNSLGKQRQNSYPFSHYLFTENKEKLAKICERIDLDKLKKSCQVEIKNCQDRYLWNWLGIIGFCSFFILGIILIIVNVILDHHTHGMLIAGIIICIIDIIVVIVVYFVNVFALMELELEVDQCFVFSFEYHLIGPIILFFDKF